MKAADLSDGDSTADAATSSQPRRLRHKTLIREPVKYASTYLQPLRMVSTRSLIHSLVLITCSLPHDFCLFSTSYDAVLLLLAFSVFEQK